MEENLITEFKYELLKSFSDEEIFRIESILRSILSKSENALVVSNGQGNLELIKQFVIQKKVQNLSDKSLKYYVLTFESFNEFLRGKPFQSVTSNDVISFLGAKMYKDKVTSTTANNLRRNLSSFFTFLQEFDFIVKNPMARVKKINEVREKKKAFSATEIAKIRKALTNKRDRAIFELLLHSGIRVGGLCGLKFDDINFSEKSITVFEKGRKYRTVYFNEEAEFYLKEYLEERENLDTEDEHIFVSLLKPYKKLQISGVEIMMRQAGRETGVKNVHPHRFRRTFATTALKKGMSIIDIKNLLGHKKLDTTQIYLDETEGLTKAAYTKVF
jgi:hypothetical protein